MNNPVIFVAKGTQVHPRPRSNKFVTKYVLTEASCVIPNKEAYMDDKTWEKVLKVVSPGIIKMAVRNVAFVFFILFSTYINIHLYSSRLSADDL